MRRAAVVRIEPNRESFDAARRMLERVSGKSEALERFLEISDRPVDLGDLPAKLFRVEAECLPAGGACHLSVSLQPTDLLLRLLAAAGAWNV